MMLTEEQHGRKLAAAKILLDRWKAGETQKRLAEIFALPEWKVQALCTYAERQQRRNLLRNNSPETLCTTKTS